MRIFVQLRRLMDTDRDLARKIETLEKKYDEQFSVVFERQPRYLFIEGWTLSVSHQFDSHLTSQWNRCNDVTNLAM